MTRITQPVRTILDAIGILTANFTAATTGIITSAAHGLKNRDLVVLTTTGTLPAGLATATVYVVTDATTDTFKLKIKSTGVPVTITDTGSGTHTFTMHDIGYSIDVNSWKDKEISLNSSGSANMVVKFQGSYQEEEPDFSAAQAVDNQWDYVCIRDREDNSTVDGDTGITFSAADDHRMFNVETNNIKWLNCIISSWVAGAVTVKVKLAND